MSKSRDIADSAATINYIDGLTSDAQGQLNTATSDIATNASDIATKAPLSNPTFTGTVTATAFSGDGSSLTGVDALPSQTGNADKYLTTDGSTASWALVESGTITATASGAITAGDALIMNADGTVSTATSTDKSVNIEESAFLPMKYDYFNYNTYYAETLGGNCVAYDSNSNQYFYMSKMSDGSTHWNKIQKISFDEYQRISMNNSDTIRMPVSTYYFRHTAMGLNSKTGFGVMSGIYTQNSYATFIPVRFNKDNLSMSQTYNKNLFNNCNVVYNIWADETDNKFIIYHRNTSGYPTIATAYTTANGEYDCELFGGSQYVVSSTGTGSGDPRYANGYFHKASGKFILVYTDGGSTYVKVATRSGDTFTLGTAQTVFTSTVDYTRPFIDYSETEDVFIFSAEDSANSNLKVVAGSLSGTTFTFGSPVNTTMATDYQDSGGTLALDPYSRLIIITARKFACTSISGTTITTPSNFHDLGDAGWQNEINNVRSSNVFYNKDTGYAFALDQYGGVQAARVITTNINPNNFVGLAATSVSDGQSVTVTVRSGTNTNQSGLVTGQAYYINAHGNLTTNNTGLKAGIAKSSTELVMV